MHSFCANSQARLLLSQKRERERERMDVTPGDVCAGVTHARNETEKMRVEIWRVCTRITPEPKKV